jgi:hypothetical protein
MPSTAWQAAFALQRTLLLQTIHAVRDYAEKLKSAAGTVPPDRYTSISHYLVKYCITQEGPSQELVARICQWNDGYRARVPHSKNLILYALERPRKTKEFKTL